MPVRSHLWKGGPLRPKAEETASRGHALSCRPCPLSSACPSTPSLSSPPPPVQCWATEEAHLSLFTRRQVLWFRLFKNVKGGFLIPRLPEYPSLYTVGDVTTVLGRWHFFFPQNAFTALLEGTQATRELGEVLHPVHLAFLQLLSLAFLRCFTRTPFLPSPKGATAGNPFVKDKRLGSQRMITNCLGFS